MPLIIRDTGWFKSSRSAAASDNCVEVRFADVSVSVRDSKTPDDGMLTFGADAWASFVRSLSASDPRD